MNENPFNKSSGLDVLRKELEKLDVDIEIAGPGDWEALKEIRTIAINSKDAKMFGGNIVEADRAKIDEDWKAEVQKKKIFYTLVWNGSEAIGMGRARYFPEDGVWYISSVYMKEKFRGKVSPRKAMQVFIDEIKKRGGSKVALGVRTINERAIKLYEALGFRKVEPSMYQYLRHPIKKTKWQEMEKNLDNNEG